MCSWLSDLLLEWLASFCFYTWCFKFDLSCLIHCLLHWCHSNQGNNLFEKNICFICFIIFYGKQACIKDTSYISWCIPQVHMGYIKDAKVTNRTTSMCTGNTLPLTHAIPINNICCMEQDCLHAWSQVSGVVSFPITMNLGVNTIMLLGLD